MIQRRQTLFLLLAAIALVVAAFAGTGTLPMLIVLILSAILSVGDIFLYKNRKRQALVVLVTMFLLVIWYILMAVENRNTAGHFQLHWTHVLPMVAVFLLVLARKGIIKDEKLVRSLDRIR
jgi:4-hydroxybenzoate polyprenyltransferase